MLFLRAGRRGKERSKDSARHTPIGSRCRRSRTGAASLPSLVALFRAIRARLPLPAVSRRLRSPRRGGRFSPTLPLRGPSPERAARLSIPRLAATCYYYSLASPRHCTPCTQCTPRPVAPARPTECVFTFGRGFTKSPWRGRLYVTATRSLSHCPLSTVTEFRSLL